MSKFADNFADAAVPSLLDQLGEEIQYGFADNSERTITAIVRLDAFMTMHTDQGEHHERTASITISTADAEAGVTTAELENWRGQYFIASCGRFNVVGVEANNGKAVVRGVAPKEMRTRRDASVARLSRGGGGGGGA